MRFHTVLLMDTFSRSFLSENMVYVRHVWESQLNTPTLFAQLMKNMNLFFDDANFTQTQPNTFIFQLESKFLMFTYKHKQSIKATKLRFPTMDVNLHSPNDQSSSNLKRIVRVVGRFNLNVDASEIRNQKWHGKWSLLLKKEREHVINFIWFSQRFHGNEQLVNGPRFHMMVEADQSLYYIAKLEIRGVQATDKGEYRAVATNKHGESVATINLNFDSSAGGAPK